MKYVTLTPNQEERRLTTIIERDGCLPVPPLVQVTSDDQFTLLDGHKPVWATYVAGPDTVQCRSIYVDKWTAASIFANCHLDWDDVRLDERARRETIRRPRNQRGDDTDERPRNSIVVRLVTC